MATYRLTILNKARVAEAARGLFQIESTILIFLDHYLTESIIKRKFG